MRGVRALLLGASIPALHRGYMAAVGAAIAYGGAHVIARRIVQDVPPLVGSAFSLTAGAVLLVVLFRQALLREQGAAPPRAYLYIVLAGLVSACGSIALYWALSKAPVVVVSPIVGTNPLVSILLSRLFLQRTERVTWRIVLGALLVVGGVALIALGRA
ncbi:MAG: DMT family transporter [Chloroflexi bacterium]|nr:DMT family transporter [Chloroflexota bacterium]